MDERDELIDRTRARVRELGEQRDLCLKKIADLKDLSRDLSREQNEVVARMNELMTERMRDREKAAAK
jgi:hypothetical protein